LSELPPDDLLAQIRELELGQFLLSTAATLLSLAYGKLEAGELAQARLGIDAVAAVVPLLEGHVEPAAKRGLEQTLTGLKLAYAESAAASAPPADPNH